MTVKLLCIGKVKDRGIKQAIDDYLTRLRYYTSIEYLELKAEKRKKTDNDAQVKQRECEHISKRLTPQDVVIALDEHGEHYTSVEFAHVLAEYQVRGEIKHVVFVTGGPTGFTDEFLKRADKILSLSKMTLPHQLCRLIFAEQLYRAYTILAGEAYHKA